jgi:hypothetical protein
MAKLVQGECSIDAKSSFDPEHYSKYLQ